MAANANLSPAVWIGGWLVFLAMLTMLLMAWLSKQENPNANLAHSAARTLVLKRNRFDHYQVPGKINGVPVQFMIDTGASSVAIPASVAARLNLPIGIKGLAETANGVTATRVTIAEQVSVGGIRLKNISVSVLPNAAGDEVLLGMSFLKHLDWQQQGDQLMLALPAEIAD